MLIQCELRCIARSMQAMFAEPEEARILMRMNYEDAKQTDIKIHELLRS